MKLRFVICFFALCASVAAAQVRVINSSSGVVEVDSVPIAAGTVATVVSDDGTPYVEAAGHSAIVEVLNGTVIEVDDQDVTTATPLSSYQPVFMKGFWTGMGFELFGLLLAIMRKVRAGTGMAND